MASVPKEEEELWTEHEPLEAEDDCSDDGSDEDPSFDLLEETRSRLSKISLKKTRPRIGKKVCSESDDDTEITGDVKVPKLNAKDAKTYEEIEKMIRDGQLDKIKVDQCKIYLRKHGLRLMGIKDVLLGRIKEHLAIINGGSEMKYPTSSFIMNCQGDACTGDIVMFEQKVYEMFSIASRSATGPPCGTRTVVGRIVKESYGAAKQQHTFTIEVLWSKGEKPLPPLHPLLIKGRNLYRLKTMRQRWDDEDERRKVLQEKHMRGSVARNSRELRIQQKEMTRNQVKRHKDNMPPLMNHHPQMPPKQDAPKQLQNNHPKRTLPPISKDDCGRAPLAHSSHNYGNNQVKLPPNVDRYHTREPVIINSSSHNVKSQNVGPVWQQSHVSGTRHHEMTNKVHEMQHGSIYFQAPAINVKPSHVTTPSILGTFHHYSGASIGQPTLPHSNNSGALVGQSLHGHRIQTHNRQSCRFDRQGRCRYMQNCKFLHE